MRPGLTLALAGLLAAASLVSQLSAASEPGGSTARAEAASTETRVIGRSVRGRPIVARQLGDPSGERVALAVGVIHGDERAGLKVTRALRRVAGGLEGVQVWVIDTLNPDGGAARTRGNARRVDLNRNFPHRWRGGVPASSGYYPGRRRASEPETRAAMSLIREIEPDVSVWYHQPWGAVLACRGRPRIAKRYAKLARMRTSCQGRGLRGTAIGWQQAKVGGAAFVVEFGRRGISSRGARRHARALVRVARRSGGEAKATAAVKRPSVVKRLIPYPAARRAQMAAYSKRHYGQGEWRLTSPKLIVIHHAQAGSIGSIYNTFAANRPDPEFGERPGVCTHFAVSAKGVGFKLVPPRIRCRHVVGLNHVALGIEHVGFSDRQVLRRKRQRTGSLRLTHRLRCRFGIPIKGVIGHAESLSSPHYLELDPDFRGRTHSDFKRRSMRVYRSKLRKLKPC